MSVTRLASVGGQHIDMGMCGAALLPSSCWTRVVLLSVLCTCVLSVEIEKEDDFNDWHGRSVQATGHDDISALRGRLSLRSLQHVKEEEEGAFGFDLGNFDLGFGDKIKELLKGRDASKAKKKGRRKKKKQETNMTSQDGSAGVPFASPRKGKIKSVAYLFACHSKNTVRGALNQIRWLHHRDDVFYIHIDADPQDSTKRELVRFAEATVRKAKWPNVAVQSRIKVEYATFSMLEPFLLGLNYILCKWPTHDWSYVMNLSGDTMPLAPRTSILERLEGLKGFDWAQHIRNEEKGIRPTRRCPFVDDPDPEANWGNAQCNVERMPMAWKNYLEVYGVHAPGTAHWASEWFELTRAFVGRIFDLTPAKARKVTASSRHCIAAMSEDESLLPTSEREDTRLGGVFKLPYADWVRDWVYFSQKVPAVDEMFIPSLMMQKESGTKVSRWDQFTSEELPANPHFMMYTFLDPRSFHSATLRRHILLGTMDSEIPLDNGLPPIFIRKVNPDITSPRNIRKANEIRRSFHYDV